MNHKFSKSWINMRIDYDNTSRSDILVNYLKKHKQKSSLSLIDFCCGSGSFFIWALEKEILCQNCLLIDNDINLLKSVKSNLRSYFKDIYKIESNTNNLDLRIKKFDKPYASVVIEKYDCDKYEKIINTFHIISYSAALDLMSKKSINLALKRVNDNNILYFSLCFNGQVKWTPSNTFDKYILSHFNTHQRTDKGVGLALGSKSIEYIRKQASRFNYKIIMKDAPWVINNIFQKDIIFMKRYVLDIKKSLFHMDGIDKDILRQWYEEKIKDIENKKIRLCVGHKDILIYK